jgi:tRNA (cytidine/uridine-2'-O-)-methyltransferase
MKESNHIEASDKPRSGLVHRAGMPYQGPPWLCMPRWWAFTTRGRARHDEVRFADGDALVFGPETRGLPDDVLQACPVERHVRIPMVAGARSLNLSNAVAVITFEAWRQQGFATATAS